MKKEVIGTCIGVAIISLISFVSSCLYNYELINYHVYNKEYISYDYGNNLEFNKNIYKLKRHKIPTIIIKEENR